MSEKNRSVLCNISAPVSAPRKAQSDNSQYLTVANSNIDLSLENRASFEIKKAPAKYREGLELGNRDLNDPTQTPEKQGFSTLADNSTAYFTAYSNFCQQIFDLFDRLTPDEQSALLNALQARVQSAADTSR